MTDQHPTQPWPGGFAAPPDPAAQPLPPNVTAHAPGDLSALVRGQQQAPKRTRAYHRFELPVSVTRSMYWTGSDADRFFGLWEPQSGEVRKLAKTDAEFSDAAQNFIAAIGVPDQHGQIVRGPPTDDEPDGVPVLADVTDSTRQSDPWWARLSPKAQTLVTSMFVEFIMPTAEEGESLRASRRCVGV